MVGGTAGVVEDRGSGPSDGLLSVEGSLSAMLVFKDTGKRESGRVSV